MLQEIQCNLTGIEITHGRTQKSCQWLVLKCNALAQHSNFLLSTYPKPKNQSLLSLTAKLSEGQCAASAQIQLVLLKLSATGWLNSHITEPATVPIQRGSLLLSPASKSNRNSGTETEQKSGQKQLNFPYHSCEDPKRTRTCTKLLQGKIQRSHHSHSLFSG